jgi:hypothetical protein
MFTEFTGYIPMSAAVQSLSGVSGGDVLKWIGYDGESEASRCVSAFVVTWQPLTDGFPIEGKIFGDFLVIEGLFWEATNGGQGLGMVVAPCVFVIRQARVLQFHFLLHKLKSV